VVRAVQGVIVFPLQRMWRSPDPIDAYGLNHLTSVAGDALLAISLADSIFFHVPVAESRLRVALFLGLTVLPLALAGPLIVPILDRAGPRRSVTFAAAAGRCLLALFLAPQLDSNLLFPIVLLMLVLSKIHGLVKNGLTMAYASRQEGLMRANARLGRIAVAGAIGAAPVGFLTLKAFGGAGPSTRPPSYTEPLRSARSACHTRGGSRNRTPAATWRHAAGSRSSRCRRWGRSGSARPGASCCS